MDLQFDGSLPRVEIGDECVIYLDEQKSNHDGFVYQVTRVGTSDIAVSIIDI